jgi:SAM-dependent methyltransferase
LVVDKYVVDDFERPGEQAISFRRPLVVADGEDLPFGDGAFGYVIASHVLEHAHNPSRFAAELSRVAAAGFVQVPSREAELTFGWDYHPWLIDRSGDRLVFSPRGDSVAPLGQLFHEAYGTSPFFRMWFASVRGTFHHSVEWRGELVVEALGGSSAAKTAEVDIERTTHLLSDAQSHGVTQPLTDSLRSLLRCPHCKGRLRFDGRSIGCGDCDGRYVMAGDVPILLT